MNLADCFDKHDCDKGTRGHGYDRVYEPIFQALRDEPIRLLEIGILRGQSIAAWLDYFPRAMIVGLDTFERVPAGKIAILKHPRVTWHECDSTKGPPDMPAGFDVIIDDGLHTPAAQRATFAGFMPLLKERGAYFIEDVLPYDDKTLTKHRNRWPGCTEDEYKLLLSSLEAYRVTHHDLRDNAHKLSYMLEVRR